MNRQDAISMLGVSDATFDHYVKDKRIRRTSLRNGRYNYNDEDVYKLIDLKLKQSHCNVVCDSINDDTMLGLFLVAQNFDHVEVKVKSKNVAFALEQLAKIAKNKIDVILED